MFIFLLFASDGCRNVCQIFSHRLVAHLRNHRRKAAERRARVEVEAKQSPTTDQPAATPTSSSSRWRTSIRTWIKCVCACACVGDGGGGVRQCSSFEESDTVRTLGKLFLKLAHQA